MRNFFEYLRNKFRRFRLWWRNRKQNARLLNVLESFEEQLTEDVPDPRESEEWELLSEEDRDERLKHYALASSHTSIRTPEVDVTLAEDETVSTVFIETTFDPGDPRGPRLRLVVNDDEVMVRT